MASSPGCTADSSGPRKNSLAGTSRSPPWWATRTAPSSTASTAGISPAGSACTMLPTVVPRLRIAAWATNRSAFASSGWAAAAAGSASTSACRASAPTRTWPSSTRT